MSDTPRIGHAPIPMRRVERGYDNLEQPGDFFWRITDEGERELWIALPHAEERFPFNVTRWTIDHDNDCGAILGPGMATRTRRRSPRACTRSGSGTAGCKPGG